MPVSGEDAPVDQPFDPLWSRLNAEHGVRRIKSRPIRSADGRALGSFFIAFTTETPSPWPEEIEATCARLAGFALERHRAAERNRLIVGEMQHRLKNLFVSVLSIAVQTSQSGQTSADLAHRIVAPFAGAGAIEITGKPFKVAPSSVVPFSLVLHELATNAAKYGALSNAQGKTRISWKYYRTESGERRFKFKGEESGSPSVTPPRRSGFGTILMKRAFADVEGQSRLIHAPEGLRYKVDAPVSGRLGRLHEGATPASDAAADQRSA
jgi:two-component sensor histidine kinase